MASGLIRSRKATRVVPEPARFCTVMFAFPLSLPAPSRLCSMITAAFGRRGPFGYDHIVAVLTHLSARDTHASESQFALLGRSLGRADRARARSSRTTALPVEFARLRPSHHQFWRGKHQFQDS